MTFNRKVDGAIVCVRAVRVLIQHARFIQFSMKIRFSLIFSSFNKESFNFLYFCPFQSLNRTIQLNDKLTAYELVCLCALLGLCMCVPMVTLFFAAVLTVLISIEEEERAAKPSFITENTFIPSYVLCVSKQASRQANNICSRVLYKLSHLFVYFGFTKEIIVGLKYSSKLKIIKER